MTLHARDRRSPDVIFRALGAGLLVLGLSFLLFGAGLYIEGLIDLSDGRMDGHASLDLSHEVATHHFQRRIAIMLSWSGALLASALACFWIARVAKPRAVDAG